MKRQSYFWGGGGGGGNKKKYNQFVVCKINPDSGKGKVKTSRHTTLKQRRFNVDSTSRRFKVLCQLGSSPDSGKD